ncbi:23S rRNA (guanosine(2251)-2'-O)-methyltransferase RlmB [Bacillus fonticola]|uniref:23S rRNA (guanosine(2251)-2'-O)-methyltransferase RlmB n=1 Tax=Bacillus fonticola TaxID=2728853 RepID=UPI00147348FA|nr:23S rRNA (guanosine(2251)-2'-O)-methyltransferase RlmB [Bacillus fonticola]
MKAGWIYGKNTVLEALRKNETVDKVYVAEGAQRGTNQTIMNAAKDRGIRVEVVPKQKLNAMTDIPHQGVAAQIAAYEYAELDDLFAVAQERGEDPFFLILDEVEDPHNLGSMLRTADCTGVHGIIIPKRRAVGLTATVAKASTGAIEHVKVARVTNIARTIEELQQSGVWIAGTDATGNTDFRQMDGTMPLALVIGSEGKGMSRLVREKCDFLISLPMTGHVTSLNASVAGALVMYEVYRKRHPVG